MRTILTTIFASMLILGLSACSGPATKSGGMQMPASLPADLGSQQVEGMEMRLAILPPRTQLVPMEGEWRELQPISGDSSLAVVAWSVQLTDLNSGLQIPYASVTLEITGGGGTQEVELAPTWTSEGLRYQVLATMMPDGKYTVGVRVAPVQISRDERTQALWSEDIRAEFEVEVDDGGVVSQAQHLTAYSAPLPDSLMAVESRVIHEGSEAGFNIEVLREEGQTLYVWSNDALMPVEPLADEVMLKVKLTAQEPMGAAIAYTKLFLTAESDLVTEGVVSELQPLWTADGIVYVAYTNFPEDDYRMTLEFDAPLLSREQGADGAAIASQLLQSTRYSFALGSADMMPMMADAGMDQSTSMESQDMAAEMPLAVEEPAMAEPVVEEPMVEEPVVATSMLTSGRSYAVQVGLFQVIANADRAESQLEGAGLQVARDTVSWSEGELQRVRVGPYGEREAAESARSEIDSLLGVTSIMVVSCGEGGGSAGYRLQVGTFRSSANAEAMVAKLQAAGQQAQAEPVDVGGESMQRVTVGPFADRATAQEVKPQLDDEWQTNSLLISGCN